MRKTLIVIFLFSMGFVMTAQSLEEYHKSIQQYEPSKENPFGQMNPNAPKELKEFDFMVGVCDCVDSIPQSGGKWITFPSIWQAKYFLNGYGIQDNNFNPQNPTSNLRLFDKSTKQWKVTYVSGAQNYFTGEWVGIKEGEDLILYRKSGEGQPYSKLTFYNISDRGYDWKSETILPDGSSRLGWNKKCKKR